MTPVRPPGPVIDVDSHLTDADEKLWRPYFAERDAHLAPRVVTIDGVDRLDVAGLLLPRPSGPGVGSPLGIGAATHVASLDERVAFMRDLNIVRALLLPGFVGLAALNHHDRQVRAVLARAHNNLVYDLASRVEQIEFVPVLLPDDSEWSLAELRHWGSRVQLRAVVSRPTTWQARPFRDATTLPIVNHLAAEGIVLVLHAATGYHQASPMAEQFDDYRFTHVFSHPFEHMLALADLIGSGALGGGLRVGLVEAGCGWLPWFAGRLQGHFDQTGGLPRLDVDVDELITRQVILGVEPGDTGIDSVLARFGPSVLAFGSDFPHWDAAHPDDLVALSERLGPEVTSRILFDNSQDFFFARR
ncbi:amidohydrolase family protein [Micromonospora sp. RP3T]|uniref:amidohydrolase family protein n=1 Tax=Micromonospora sp. RP3T TaxID=2135446 RepID=UPI003D7525E6